MGSSDILTSAKGPGLIGSLLALVVLAGFGFMTLHVMDEAERDPSRSIESIIASQEKEIVGLQDRIVADESRIAEEPRIKEQRLELSKLTRENRYRADEIKALEERAELGRGQVAQKLAEFDAYKNEYRAYIRAKSKGMELPTLTTMSGVVYDGVKIREITPIGIQILHQDGQKRLPYEELPAAMQDLFQFDAAQKQLALQQELEAEREHGKATAAAVMKQQETNTAQREAEKERQSSTRREALANFTAQQLQVEKEIENLETAIPLEQNKRLSRAPQMRRQLDNMKRQMAAITAKINELQTQ